MCLRSWPSWKNVSERYSGGSTANIFSHLCGSRLAVAAPYGNTLTVRLKLGFSDSWQMNKTTIQHGGRKLSIPRLVKMGLKRVVVELLCPDGIRRCLSMFHMDRLITLIQVLCARVRDVQLATRQEGSDSTSQIPPRYTICAPAVILVTLLVFTHGRRNESTNTG